jgi:hypothetical protein
VTTRRAFKTCMEVKTLQATTSMSILSLSKQPLIWCHIRNRYWYTPRISITFANHHLCMNTQHTCPYQCCYITHSPNPLKKWWGLAPSHLYGWFEEGMLPPSAPAPNISNVPKRLHSQQSHKLFMCCWSPCKHPLCLPQSQGMSRR